MKGLQKILPIESENGPAGSVNPLTPLGLQLQ